MDLRGYRGVRGRRSVLGRWKDTDVRTLRRVCEAVPLRAAFLAVFAWVVDEEEAGAAGQQGIHRI